MSRQISTDWLKTRPIAHRGLHNLSEGIPENSIKAFERAIAHGYAIELDVFVSQDDEAIVFHDDNLMRSCERAKSTASLTVEELSDPQFRLFGTRETIPLLKDVLKLVNGRTPILVEIKKQPNANYSNHVILNTLLKYHGPYAVQSFDPRVVRWFSKKAPLVPRGQIAGDFKNERLPRMTRWVLRNMLFNRYTDPHFVVYDIRALPSKSVNRAKDRGRTVLGWTVNSPEEAVRARQNCENIVFEGFLP